MGIDIYNRFRSFFSLPHPTFQLKESRDRILKFLSEENDRSPGGYRLNIGSGGRRFDMKVFNLDLFLTEEIDIQGDLLNLPIKDETIDTVVCTGVLEHIRKPDTAVQEIFRVLKCGGCMFIETPFMQTYHVSPKDYYRWTPDGLRQILSDFKIVEFHVTAGPASALAWQFQETMAMLFCFNNQLMHKIGLRIFGWLAVPLSWLDVLLERNPRAWRAASGYALVVVKNTKIGTR